MTNNTVWLGTELKLNIHIEPIDGLTMDDYDFSVDVYCSPKRAIHVTKNECIRLDESHYIVLVDTAVVGVGSLICKVTSQLPDSDFEDMYRTEIVCKATGINIVKDLTRA